MEMLRKGSKSLQRSQSPPPPRIRDIGGEGGNNGHELVVQRVVKESGGSAVCPTLKRTNYRDWTLVMRLMLQTRGWWDAVDNGDADYQEDRIALEAILHAVPLEMLYILSVKESAKEAWDTIKTLCMRVDCVRKAKAQSLCKEFDAITFHDGKTVNDFAIRLINIVNNLHILYEGSANVTLWKAICFPTFWLPASVKLEHWNNVIEGKSNS